MIENPTWFVTPTGYRLADGTGPFEPSMDPLSDCVACAEDGDSIQLSPGTFPPMKAATDDRKNLHFCGWKDQSGALVSSVSPDYAVGSTDTFRLGPGATGFVLEDLLLPCDDRAAVKTVSGVGPKHALIGCSIYGPGSPMDPLWTANTKWGVHAYETAGWTEQRVWKWSIFHEHGDYLHNIQGNHAFVQGGAGNLGGCDIFIANRQNEGPEGKGNVDIIDRYTEDACVGQGGSALSFRGGMPKSIITITRWKLRLGCKRALASPFNQNICGGLVLDSADETTPGAGDAAWPGGTAELHMQDCDLEVGTIYPGRTGMIRPVVSVAAVKVFTWLGGRMKVTRSPGAYPIGLNIEPSVEKVAIGAVGGSSPEWDAWVQYHGTRYNTLQAFLTAHPEAAA